MQKAKIAKATKPILALPLTVPAIQPNAQIEIENTIHAIHSFLPFFCLLK